MRLINYITGHKRPKMALVSHVERECRAVTVILPRATPDGWDLSTGAAGRPMVSLRQYHFSRRALDPRGNFSARRFNEPAEPSPVADRHRPTSFRFVRRSRRPWSISARAARRRNDGLMPDGLMPDGLMPDGLMPVGVWAGDGIDVPPPSPRPLSWPGRQAGP
jgi:hypothetical protein